MVPQVFYSMHLLLHQLLMPWIMVLGGCVLLGSAVRVLTRRQVDSSIVLTAMVMVYSYLIGIVGDYYEGARYGVYWKLPAVFLAAWSVTAGVRIIQRVTPRLRESLRVRGRAFTGKWGKWRDKWRRTKADSTT
jgi:hypothetical protein